MDLLLKSKEQKFWSWFLDNEERLLNFEQEQDVIFGEMHSRLKQVDEDLVFEFGPNLDNGGREMVLSAGGIESTFPAVEALHSAAPKLDKWSVVKFSPRRNPLNDLLYMGKTVSVEDVYYLLVDDISPDKIGIMLFLKDYNEAESSIWWELGFLFLDQALGEYDVGTKLGTIIIDSTMSEYNVDTSPLVELSDEFDSYFVED
jgi:hypothetical protein